MNLSILTNRFQKLQSFEFGRLAQLWVLAVVVLSYSVLEMAIANSLFLTKVGAGQLPLVFILIGLGSLPSYLIFSQVVDRYSRPRLFQFAIAAAIVIALGLRGLIVLDSPWVYYLLMIVLFFQWDFHNTILYSSLLPDYFTATEYKQYTPALGLGQAVGIFLGGILTSVLPLVLPTEDLLFVVPGLMVAAIALLRWLETSQVKLITPKQSQDVGVIEALRTFPKLVQRYPLMLFLAGSSFLLVIIYLTTEFLWFSVYEQYFTSDELTEFLGLMRVVVSVLQMVILYCFTSPFLKWFGVGRMNVVYPITTLVSLFCFLFKINLWTGIGLHLNGDGFFKSINLPVHQLNYNAIPEEFIGRIRTLSDGVFYAMGLTLVGVFLLFAHAHLDLTQISWIAVGLGLCFLMLRIPMGRFYGAGLEDMIRSNTINLADLPQGSTLPKENTEALIRDWLRSPFPEQQYRALEMALEIGAGHWLLEDILRLPNHADDRLRQKILAVLVESAHADIESQLIQLLTSELSAHCAIALEALIAREYKFSGPELVSLQNSEVSEIRLLAEVAHPSDTWKNVPMGDSAGLALLRVTPYHATPELIRLILNLLSQSTQFAIAALRRLTQLDEWVLPDAWRSVFSYLTHADEDVRVAAYQFLAKHYPDKVRASLVSACGDPAPKVRDCVAEIIADSENGLAMAQQALKNSESVAQLTAIASLAQINSKPAQDLLYLHLAPDFQLLKLSRQWRKQIGTHDRLWPLTIAVDDFQSRLVQKVFFILSKMGYSTTVNAINNSLMYSTGRDRANAIEVLSSLKERRFIRPLLPVLESNDGGADNKTPQLNANVEYKILEQALKAEDAWIRHGVLATLAAYPESDLIQLAPSLHKVAGSAKPYPMDRILLLKKVPIFQNLTLDELDLISQELTPVEVLAQQVIYEEGSWGQYFYVIEAGAVELTKQIGDRAMDLKQLGMGEYFGEICLFDDAPRWDGAIALTDATLLKLEKEKFKALMMQRPRISLEICRYLSQRLREFDNFCDIQSKDH